MRNTIKIGVFLLFLFSMSIVTFAQDSAYIITSPNVKLRAASNARSAEVTNLSMGTLVTKLQQSTQKTKVGEVEDFWYKIDAGNRKSGWVFGGFLKPFDPTQRIETYLDIMTPFMRTAPTVYEDEIDKYNFLAKAVTEAEDRSQIAELTLANLVTVKRILTIIYKDPKGTNAYRSWISAHQNELTFHQATGKYYFNPEVLWRLQDEFHDVHFGDRIAYEAARTDLPGSCGGNVACEVDKINKREGRYLTLYPEGFYIEKVLDNIGAQIDTMLGNTSFYLLPRNAVAPFKDALADLNATVQSVENAKHEVVLEKVSRLARQFIK
jgi:hypothetical protein